MGDGLLLYSLCAYGYTYSFYFRNQSAPNSWTEKGLSPLHAQVMSLIRQLPDDTRNYVFSMDKLYISPKFANFLLNQSGKRVMIHAVCRPSRGIPKFMVQYIVTKNKMSSVQKELSSAQFLGEVLNVRISSQFPFTTQSLCTSSAMIAKVYNGSRRPGISCTKRRVKM